MVRAKEEEWLNFFPILLCLDGHLSHGEGMEGVIPRGGWCGQGGEGWNFL